MGWANHNTNLNLDPDYSLGFSYYLELLFVKQYFNKRPFYTLFIRTVFRINIRDVCVICVHTACVIVWDLKYFDKNPVFPGSRKSLPWVLPARWLYITAAGSEFSRFFSLMALGLLEQTAAAISPLTLFPEWANGSTASLEESIRQHCAQRVYTADYTGLAQTLILIDRIH